MKNVFILILIINFNILIIPLRALPYLEQRVGIVLLCSRRHPEDDTRVPKHVGVCYFSWTVFY